MFFFEEVDLLFEFGDEGAGDEVFGIFLLLVILFF
jgi:hypothetical protein